MTTATETQIRELCTISNRDDAGRHFTEWANWRELEELGLISIYRPIHEPTGIAYSQEYWQLEVTEAGQELIEANPELHPC